LRHSFASTQAYCLIPQAFASIDELSPEKSPNYLDEVEEDKAESETSNKSPSQLLRFENAKKQANSLKNSNSSLSTKLRIVSDPNYNDLVLEEKLKKFVKADCIEFIDCGISAFQILKLHETLVKI
jgi:hypothetical protein